MGKAPSGLSSSSGLTTSSSPSSSGSWERFLAFLFRRPCDREQSRFFPGKHLSGFRIVDRLDFLLPLQRSAAERICVKQRRPAGQRRKGAGPVGRRSCSCCCCRGNWARSTRAGPPPAPRGAHCTLLPARLPSSCYSGCSAVSWVEAFQTGLFKNHAAWHSLLVFSSCCSCFYSRPCSLALSPPLSLSLWFPRPLHVALRRSSDFVVHAADAWPRNLVVRWTIYRCAWPRDVLDHLDQRPIVFGACLRAHNFLTAFCKSLLFEAAKQLLPLLHKCIFRKHALHLW